MRVITTAITILVIGAVFAWIARSRQDNAKVVDGAFVLEYPVAARALAVLFGVVAIGVVVICVTLGGFAKEPIPVSLVCLGAVIGAGALLLEFWCKRVEIGPEALAIRSPWRKPWSLKWSDVQGITYSRTSQQFTIRGRDKRRLVIHSWMSGLDSLRSEAARRGISMPTPSA